MNALELNERCSYATPDELKWLTQWARSRKSYSRVVMIGAGPGVMALAIFDAGNLDLTPVTVIDHWSVEYVAAHTKHIQGKELSLIMADSRTFVWNGDPISLLIVDGDHYYEGVKADLDNWLKWVKRDGLVFLHDYEAGGTQFESQEQYPGVKQAVTECQADWTVESRVGTAIVMRML